MLRPKAQYCINVGYSSEPIISESAKISQFETVITLFAKPQSAKTPAVSGPFMISMLVFFIVEAVVLNKHPSVTQL